MKKDAIRVSTAIPVAPTTLYFAWLDSEQHTAMTGATAKLEAVVGSKFTSLDGYVSGKLVTLDLGRRIIMSWRTKDFPGDAHDSRVEIHFEGLGAGTRLTILHTEIPEGQGEQYRAVWMEKYCAPMRAHFSKFLPDPRTPPPVRRPPPPPVEEEEEEVAPSKRKRLEGKGVPPARGSAGPSVVKAAPSSRALPAKGAKATQASSKVALGAPPKGPAASAKPAVAAKPAKKPAKPTPKPAKPAKKPAKPARPAKPAKKPAKPAKKPARPAPKPAKKPAKPAKKPAKPAKKPAKRR